VVKASILFGSIAVLAQLALYIESYFDGVSFVKSWSGPMFYVPALLISASVFLVLLLVCTVKFFRRKIPGKSYTYIYIAPVIFALTVAAPKPNYLDGLHDGAKDRLDLSNLAELREKLSVQPEVAVNPQALESLQIETLKRFPSFVSLSPYEPRFQAGNGYVAVYYGGALTKHWGLVVSTDEPFPLETVPHNMYRKVEDGVWVYMDIW